MVASEVEAALPMPFCGAAKLSQKRCSSICLSVPAHCCLVSLAHGYSQVHVLPILLTRPRRLTRAHNIVKTLFSATRSAAFLSSFVSSIWIAVCLTRTLVLARLLPWLSHDFWDGPYGCAFMGTLVCGGSIWIEQGRRRGEMALYVLPRAIRACLPEVLIRSGRRVQILERFVLGPDLSSQTADPSAWQDRLCRFPCDTAHEVSPRLFLPPRPLALDARIRDERPQRRLLEEKKAGYQRPSNAEGAILYLDFEYCILDSHHILLECVTYPFQRQSLWS